MEVYEETVQYSMLMFVLRGLVCFALATGSLAYAAKYRAVHNFTGGIDGSLPIWSGKLNSDGTGSLYGTALEGGINGAGTVFKLSPSSRGWTNTVLYSFPGSPVDGSYPDSGLVFDSAGNLYGTTQGGALQLGTVFELSPNAEGGWTETLLYSFQGNGDGAYPTAVVLDKSGRLYGATSAGGQDGVGTVFELTRSGGIWNETLIYSFRRDGVDGQSPNGVVLDGAGNLYGTTIYGGNNNDFGTVFELSQSGGVWTETVLYNFEYYNGNHDGAYPYAGVTLDKAGHLYGTTNYGGAGTDCPPGSCGAVYELKKSNGTWKELVLYSFRGGRDGSLPQAGVTLDAAGNLYGTTSFGGGGACTLNGLTGCGTFFELQKSGAKWVEKVVRLDGKNGANPQAGVILGKKGEIFGTTLYGGTGSCQGNLPGCGVVFELIP
jgi:uncharacterized repeat protein (TIGR03803 family)